jgi:hypothetical protein
MILKNVTEEASGKLRCAAGVFFPLVYMWHYSLKKWPDTRLNRIRRALEAAN